jgi:hypothetical protein
MPAFDRERAAAILVDALYLGDQTAAEKWKVTSRTLRNYRERLATDPVFSAIFHEKRQASGALWAADLARALSAGIRRLAEFAERASEPDLETVRELRGIVRDLAEIAIIREVLDADGPAASRADTLEARALPAPARDLPN